MADIVFSGVNFTGGFAITAPPTSYKAIFGYGTTGVPNNTSITNLVSDTGVVGNDVTGVGTARETLAAASYGT